MFKTVSSESCSVTGTVMCSRSTSWGKIKKTQTMENFTGFALKVQSKNCTEMEKLIENKLSREQMPTIYHSRHEKWCRGASMTKQKGMEAIENKKAFFKKLEKMEKVINFSRLNT